MLLRLILILSGALRDNPAAPGQNEWNKNGNNELHIKRMSKL
jgi:hypothetical protein